jgi:hypothetical protein
MRLPPHRDTAASRTLRPQHGAPLRREQAASRAPCSPSAKVGEDNGHGGGGSAEALRLSEQLNSGCTSSARRRFSNMNSIAIYTKAM